MFEERTQDHPSSRNRSAHKIDNYALDSIVNEFIPPKKTSVMKTVDATVERSLAAAFCRLLVQNVLDYTKRTDQSIEKVELTDDVMIYDAIELMEKAWDLVPQSVVLNA